MKGRFGSEQRIGHALDAIEAIEGYITGQTFAAFISNSMMLYAYIKQREIIGEACRHVDEQTMAAHQEVEWRKVIGLRNLLIHEYFGVDAALVWDIIQNNLPGLKEQLTNILVND